MKSSILLFVTLTVCFRLVFSLDCINAPGISFIPCQNPSTSSTGGSGGTGGASSQDNTIAVQPCTDIQYNGGTPQKYIVANQGVPQEFELIFETLNIPDGEKLLIKTFKCDPNNECKIAVIDSTAATPFSVSINKYSFTLASPSSSVSATFKVNNDCTPGCDDFTLQVGSKMVKQQPAAKTFQDCVDACETTYSRMLKATSMEESNAIASYFSNVWLGVKQTGRNTYKWNDDTTFTVTLADGGIQEYGSIKPWFLYEGHFLTYMWDKVSYDSADCLAVTNVGWVDVGCDSPLTCACECTVP